MNDTNDKDEQRLNDPGDADAQPEKQAAERQKPRGRRAIWFACLFLLLTVLGIASAGYLWLELREFRAARAWNSEQVRRLAAQFDTLRATVIPRQQLEQRLKAMDAANERLQGRLTATEKSLARLRQLTQGGRQAWHRAQLAHLLQMAHDELTLAGNTDAALIALQAADARLRTWPGSGLQTVRAAIHEAIAALQALPNPDIAGMALSLNALAARVKQLPLQAQAPSAYHGSSANTTEADKGFWQQLWQGITSSFSTMISVRRTATPIKPLLTPQQEALVYQHLALQLQTARLALLKGDYENYHASLLDAQQWLNRWFDTSHSATRATLAEIERLLAIPLPVSEGSELQAITAAIQTLENARQNAHENINQNSAGDQP